MNHQIKKTIIFYFYPLVAFRRWVIKQKKNYLGHHNPEKLAKLLYRRKFHKELNLNNPQTFNEKVNWLKFRSDTSLWTELADKYKVREYIKNNGLEEILVKLYGKWDRVEDIDFEQLPNSFVLKSNNGCGTVLLVEDKTKLDLLDNIEEALNSDALEDFIYYDHQFHLLIVNYLHNDEFNQIFQRLLYLIHLTSQDALSTEGRMSWRGPRRCGKTFSCCMTTAIPTLLPWIRAARAISGRRI